MFSFNTCDRELMKCIMIKQFKMEYLYYRGNIENGAYVFATEVENRTAFKLEDYYKESYACENPVINFTYFEGKIVTEFIVEN